MQPWEQPIPPVLYKYLHPDRLHVLADCRVRFSQRTVLPDDHELLPDVASFGTLDEIWRFVISKGISLPPELPANILVQLIAASPKAQAIASRTALGNMKSLNEFGLFCLTEEADSDRMWMEYADNGRGFVVAFATTHCGFERLSSPGKLGRVSYSDKPYGSYLGMLENEGVSFFFRKRTKYAFEKEWRSVRALRQLECQPGDIFLSRFDPGCVQQILIRPTCAVEMEIRNLVAGNPRYHHMQVTVVG